MTMPILDAWQWRLLSDAQNPVYTFGAEQPTALGLEVGAGLPVTTVTDASGVPLGILLGFPIDMSRGEMIAESWTAPVELRPPFDEFALTFLNLLSGRFLWIVDVEGQLRVYPDCCAQLPCVYDPSAQIAGATAFSLLSAADYDRRLNQPLVDALGVYGEGWFPGGLTAHHGLMRLLPNHWLDLTNWRTHRFNPQPGRTATTNPEESVTEIIEIVQLQLKALIKGQKKVAIALTAGLDTRTLLACSRAYISDIDFVTVIGRDRHEVDSVVSRKIASSLNLSHIKLPRIAAQADERERFIRRGGHCNGDSNSVFHPSVRPIADTHVFVGGAGGEVARPPILRSSDNAASKISATVLLGRLGLPNLPQLVEAIENRVASMHNFNALEILDLTYLEDRYAPWYSSQFTCDPTLQRFSPFLTSRSVDLMMRLPQQWKKEGLLSKRIIDRLWPELMDFPLNSLGPVRDGLIKLRLALADPRLITKKLRKIRS